MPSIAEPLYVSLMDLSADLDTMRGMSAEYVTKMRHPVPSVPSVDRVPWLLHHLTGHTVLHVGCLGPLHAQLLKVCARVYGVDNQPVPAGLRDYTCMDIERDVLPVYTGVTKVLLGEILEHLEAPGTLLRHIRKIYPETEVVVTIPNAFSEAGRQALMRGIEMVNAEHVAYYSYWTLQTLLTRCGYAVGEWYWYGGKPLFAEGLIMTARAT